MTQPLPSNEELQRLLKLHSRPRGPVAIDGDALARVRRWVAQEPSGFRFVIRPHQAVELTATELSDALASLVEDSQSIRQRGRRLSLEADAEPAEYLQRFRAISRQVWQLLDGRRCSRCKSYKIQIASTKKEPKWAVHCRDCGKSQRVVL